MKTNHDYSATMLTEIHDSRGAAVGANWANTPLVT